MQRVKNFVGFLILCSFILLFVYLFKKFDIMLYIKEFLSSFLRVDNGIPQIKWLGEWVDADNLKIFGIKLYNDVKITMSDGTATLSESGMSSFIKFLWNNGIIY